jgi:hypothetical protein
MLVPPTFTAAESNITLHNAMYLNSGIPVFIFLVEGCSCLQGLYRLAVSDLHRARAARGGRVMHTQVGIGCFHNPITER